MVGSTLNRFNVPLTQYQLVCGTEMTDRMEHDIRERKSEAILPFFEPLLAEFGFNVLSISAEQTFSNAPLAQRQSALGYDHLHFANP